MPSINLENKTGTADIIIMRDFGLGQSD